MDALTKLEKLLADLHSSSQATYDLYDIRAELLAVVDAAQMACDGIYLREDLQERLDALEAKLKELKL